jgi:hypothetical protein
MAEYTSSVTRLVVEDYPIGGGNRGVAIYDVESKGYKQRIRRVCEKATGGVGKPKTTTYGEKCRILIGDDGKTYPTTWNGSFYSVMQSNMKFQEESIFPDNEKFAKIEHLFDAEQKHWRGK